jgi:hypothetical protein
MVLYDLQSYSNFVLRKVHHNGRVESSTTTLARMAFRRVIRFRRYSAVVPITELKDEKQ